jgi:hypothetical protein
MPRIRFAVDNYSLPKYLKNCQHALLERSTLSHQPNLLKCFCISSDELNQKKGKINLSLICPWRIQWAACVFAVNDKVTACSL